MIAPPKKPLPGARARARPGSGATAAADEFAERGRWQARTWWRADGFARWAPVDNYAVRLLSAPAPCGTGAGGEGGESGSCTSGPKRGRRGTVRLN